MSTLERKPEGPASTPDEDLGPGSDCRGIPRGLAKSHGDWTFLRSHEWVPEVPVVTREIPPQLEKNQEILHSKQAEFFVCGIL